jgi:hypothetical protein
MRSNRRQDACALVGFYVPSYVMILDRGDDVTKNGHVSNPTKRSKFRMRVYTHDLEGN